MSKVEKLTIAQVKARVNAVEGFDLQVEGIRKIAAMLHNKKQTNGEILVSVWLAENFPDVDNGVVSVLTGKGGIAKRGDTLAKIRESYPKNFKIFAKQKVAAEKRSANTASKLKEQNKTIRQVKGSLKKSGQQTAQKINKAQFNAELGAAYQAVDKALRTSDSYHERVRELCMRAISDGLHDTQTLIERMLAAWSHAEREKDRLGK